MVQQDTIKLLRECDAGIKMGVASIDDVLGHVHSNDFRNHLNRCKKEHDALKSEIQTLLDQYHDDGKNPNPIAKGMSWMKTTMKLGMEDSDRVVADLMTDGCNMGVKSLSKYLNQYKAADTAAKDACKRLIYMEEELRKELRCYL